MSSPYAVSEVLLFVSFSARNSNEALKPELNISPRSIICFVLLYSSRGTMHRHIKSVTAAVILLGLLALISPPAMAQLALADLESKMVGSWLMTIEGIPGIRNLDIQAVAQKSEGAYRITGSFAFFEGKPAPFKDAEILQSSGNITLAFTMAGGAVYTATARPDGTFAGTLRSPKGQVRPMKLEKGAAAVAAAPASDFDGRWTGDAYPAADCVRGVYDVMIKEGRISGTARFLSSGGDRVSTVTGQVRPDNTATVVLRAQAQGGRSSRYQGTFDKDEFKGSDPVVAGGRCSYEVKLKKGS